MYCHEHCFVKRSSKGVDAICMLEAPWQNNPTCGEVHPCILSMRKFCPWQDLWTGAAY